MLLMVAEDGGAEGDGMEFVWRRRIEIYGLDSCICSIRCHGV